MDHLPIYTQIYKALKVNFYQVAVLEFITVLHKFFRFFWTQQLSSAGFQLIDDEKTNNSILTNNLIKLYHQNGAKIDDEN